MEVFELFQTFREKGTTLGAWLGWNGYMEKPKLRKTNKLLAFLSKVYMKGRLWAWPWNVVLLLKVRRRMHGR